jgi:hypothetical protein
MAHQPKFAGADHRIDPLVSPPCWFVAQSVDLAMVSPTQGHRKFITDFAPKRAALRKTEMVCIGGQSAANQTGVFGNRFDVLSVANAARLWLLQKGLVYFRTAPPLLCCVLVPTLRLSRLLRLEDWQPVCRASCKECQFSCECLLHSAAVGRCQTVLRLQALTCPDCCLVTRAEFPDLSKQSAAQFSRCRWV